MAQFRLTKKYATDMKLKKLELPQATSSVLDDWFIDVIRVQRKKVAFVTHGKTLLTFLIPYERAGGAKFIPEAIGIYLSLYLRQNNLNIPEHEIASLFSGTPIFCKTDNRKVLGHMNDFKHNIDAYLYNNNVSFEYIDWDEIMDRINSTLAKMQEDYCYPKELAKEVFSNCITKH